MRTSVTWLNDYLDPPATADEQAELLTGAGFPLDGKDTAENGEPWQEIEITSNRGDCLAHLGFAREICAVSGRKLKAPNATLPATTGGTTGGATGRPTAASLVKVTNERPDLCPLYTARVIRGVTVKPSPEWLQRRLIAIGLVPRNNLVDATNFILFELGQPTHVFDLATLAGSEIRIRMANAKEKFLPIGEGAAEVELRANDLVIADRDRAVAIAGIKGGALTAVRDSTRDILIEAASFDPVAVRASSRALRISSDSSYRFERGVHPAEVDAAADRLVALILELAGGELAAGAVRAGAAIPAPRVVTVRPARCRAVLGIDLATDTMVRRLDALGFAPKLDVAADRITCTVPARRIDIEREIDLIEEICRTNGLAAIPVRDTIAVRVQGAQPHIAARRATKDLLVGLGFVECVTHSLVSEHAAQPFVPAGGGLLAVDDERAGAEPALRPSLLPSLLRVRRHNLDNGVETLNVFECASTFAHGTGGGGSAHVETPVVAFLVDGAGNSPAERDECYRTARGTVERLARLLLGPAATVDVAPATSSALEPAGAVSINGTRVGTIGLVAPAILKQFGLERPAAAAELALEPFFKAYPPDTRAAAMPAFPATDRDVSAIVDERVTWASIVACVEALRLPNLESVAHVVTYRGKQTGTGKKSVSARLVFRAADRTLTGDEVDASVAKAISALQASLGAEIRSA